LVANQCYFSWRFCRGILRFWFYPDPNSIGLSSGSFCALVTQNI
jgi:hypothetical protein